MTEKEVNKATRLQDLTVEEVSIVDVPANKRTWLIVKSDNDLANKIRTFQKAIEGEERAIKEILRLLLGMLSDETLQELNLQRITTEGETMQGNEATYNESQTKAQEAPENAPENVSKEGKGDEGVTMENASEGVSEGSEAKQDTENKSTEADAMTDTMKALEAITEKIGQIASQLKELDKRLESVEKRGRVSQTEADHVEKSTDNVTVDFGSQAYAPVFEK